MKGLVALLVVGLVGGCAVFGGDMPVRVAGTLPNGAPDQAPTVCTIGIALVPAADVRAERTIAGSFETTFVIEARPRTYQFIASCDDGWSFRSAEYPLGGKGSFNKRIDLGVLR